MTNETKNELEEPECLSPESRLKGLPILDSKRYYFIAILLAIFFLLAIFNKQILNYASSLLGAITLFAVLRNPMRKLTKKHKWKRGWAAGLLTVVAIFLFLLPLGGLVAMLIDLFSNTQIDYNAIVAKSKEWNGLLLDRYNINILSMDTAKSLSAFGQRVVAWLFSNVSSLSINSFLMVFILFYMLLQREAFERAIMELLPFTAENKAILVSESRRIIVANAISIPVLAIIQGLFAYLGYFFIGVPNALFFGVLTAFATIVPIVGTMVVYVPLAIYFAIDGEWWRAIITTLYGLIVIGGVDNIARFLLQKWIADIHPLITVFGVIMGMALMGFWGVIFGPLLLSMLILFVNMFRHDYIPNSLAKPRVTTPVKTAIPPVKSEKIKKTLEEVSQKIKNTESKQSHK